MAARQHERLPSNPSKLTFLFSPDNKMGPGTRLKSCLIFSAIITRQQLKRTKHNLLKLIVLSTKGKYDWMWPTHCSARCVAAGRELKPSATNPDRSVSSNTWCVSLNLSSAATFFFLAFSASWGEAETHYPLYNHSACMFRARYVSSSVSWKFTLVIEPSGYFFSNLGLPSSLGAKCLLPLNRLFTLAGWIHSILWHEQLVY